VQHILRNVAFVINAVNTERKCLWLTDNDATTTASQIHTHFICEPASFLSRTMCVETLG
jgi:hypothetical protein